MIVGTRPRFRQILAEVWKPLTVLFGWDVLVTAFHFYTPFSEPPLPTTLAAALGGRKAGIVFEGDRRFDIAVRLPG